ncbi:MAG: hypothetical protein JNM56_17165 [Planctomycetia bacterium]|nr:hypothetical protein [Planctomycetia bacterium]
MNAFAHESLDVYQAAVEFAMLMERVVKLVAPSQQYLAERANQEALSLVLHVAQAASVTAPSERGELLHNAEHVAARCAALLDILYRVRVAAESEAQGGRTLLLKIVDLLAKARPRTDKPRPAPPPATPAAPAPAPQAATDPEPEED